MHKLVVIDLTTANIERFEAYERKVMSLLGQHGGQLKMSVRCIDNLTETHLLYFPDEQCFDEFLSDPARAALQDAWACTGASSTVSNVIETIYCRDAADPNE